MNDKDKLIYELQQKVCSLESQVEYLQGVLSEADIPYEKTQPKKMVWHVDFTNMVQQAID